MISHILKRLKKASGLTVGFFLFCFVGFFWFGGIFGEGGRVRVKMVAYLFVPFSSSYVNFLQKIC